jgi:predicted metal-binding protein
MCSDIDEFKHYIERCQKVIILFEEIEYSNNFDLIDKRNSFHAELLEKEHRLKMDGKYYAVCFVSGACSMCEKEKCTPDSCKRAAVGRTPICATGIDLMHLTTEILGLSKEDALSFMKQNLSKDYFDKNDNKYFCLGLILY